MRLLRHLPLLSLLPVLALADEPVRKWTDATGRSFEGSYVSATDAKVTIKRADGKVFEVERTRLSKEDQDYLTTAAKSSTPTASAGATPKFDPLDYRAHMLDGYDGSAPNFKAPWPKDAGVDKEPEITTIEENTGEKRYIYESPHFRFESNVGLTRNLISKVALMFEACYQMHHDIPLNNRRTRSPKAPKLKAFLFETMAEVPHRRWSSRQLRRLHEPGRQVPGAAGRPWSEETGLQLHLRLQRKFPHRLSRGDPPALGGSGRLCRDLDDRGVRGVHGQRSL
ncbi:MAG: SHD1 domain-containing protein [Luteolibacter sp.]